MEPKIKVEPKILCKICGGKGVMPSPTIALALPPKERRKLEKAAEENPVTCYVCGGEGISRSE